VVEYVKKGEKRGMGANRNEQYFLDWGFQYYVAARRGARAQLSPVTGNLYHHAIEMFLKARLSRSIPLEELKKKEFGHRLKSLWDAFKAEFSSEGLSQFDPLIDTLDRFESIRYPDEIVANGAQLVIAWDEKAAAGTGLKAGEAPPRYEIVVASLDKLIAEILKISSRSPAFFTGTGRLNDYARKALSYENSLASFFLPHNSEP
jgi:hypothetical protein